MATDGCRVATGESNVPVAQATVVVATGESNVPVAQATVVGQAGESSTPAVAQATVVGATIVANDGTVFCQNCGCEVATGSNFCNFCGTALPRATAGVSPAGVPPVVPGTQVSGVSGASADGESGRVVTDPISPLQVRLGRLLHDRNYVYCGLIAACVHFAVCLLLALDSFGVWIWGENYDALEQFMTFQDSWFGLATLFFTFDIGLRLFVYRRAVVRSTWNLFQLICTLILLIEALFSALLALAGTSWLTGLLILPFGLRARATWRDAQATSSS